MHSENILTFYCVPFDQKENVAFELSFYIVLLKKQHYCDLNQPGFQQNIQDSIDSENYSYYDLNIDNEYKATKILTAIHRKMINSGDCTVSLQEVSVEERSVKEQNFN